MQRGEEQLNAACGYAERGGVLYGACGCIFRPIISFYFNFTKTQYQKFRTLIKCILDLSVMPHLLWTGFFLWQESHLWLCFLTFMWQSEEYMHVVTLIIKGTILQGTLIDLLWESAHLCLMRGISIKESSGFRIWLTVSGPSISKSKQFPAWAIWLRQYRYKVLINHVFCNRRSIAVSVEKSLMSGWRGSFLTHSRLI